MFWLGRNGQHTKINTKKKTFFLKYDVSYTEKNWNVNNRSKIPTK